MAHNIGVRVIATVSTEEKAKLAREAGADEVILYTQVDFEAETKRLTGGKGVDVVYDSVGKTTFEKGLNVLRLRGMMVLFGGSSGAVPPFDLIALSQKGSLYVTRPTLVNYIATREELVERSSAVFAMIAAGKLKLRIEHTYPLAEAQRAHRDLEGRKTTGKLLAHPLTRVRGTRFSAMRCLKTNESNPRTPHRRAGGDGTGGGSGSASEIGRSGSESLGCGSERS